MHHHRHQHHRHQTVVCRSNVTKNRKTFWTASRYMNILHSEICLLLPSSLLPFSSFHKFQQTIADVLYNWMKFIQFSIFFLHIWQPNAVQFSSIILWSFLWLLLKLPVCRYCAHEMDTRIPFKVTFDFHFTLHLYVALIMQWVRAPDSISNRTFIIAVLSLKTALIGAHKNTCTQIHAYM